jgi:hypothetical protein
MDEQEFSELAIAAAIAPGQVDWPNDTVHWQRLNECVVAARAAIRKVRTQTAKIDADKGLSLAGKAEARIRIASQALAEIETSKAMTRARESVDYVQKKWAAQIGTVIKPAADVAEAAMHSQTRSMLLGMKPEQRMTWLSKHAGDPTIASAILTAPQALSGLNDHEWALVRGKAEHLALSAEQREAKAAVEAALPQAERGWTAAQRMLGELGAVPRGPDGVSPTPTTQRVSVARPGASPNWQSTPEPSF